MFTRLSWLLTLFCNISVISHAQNDKSPLLNIGDNAPPLRVGTWLKGTPVQQFEKGKVYVVEFWATWCSPCIKSMPHLSALAREYKDRATIIGVDVYERESTSIQNVKKFVDSMDNRMDYCVAAADSNYTVADWIEATGEQNSGIPEAFVVNAAGKLAWIGHPKDLDDVLHQIINNNLNIQEALTKKKEERRLEALVSLVRDTLNRYSGDPHKWDDLGHPDSVLLVINNIVTNEPKLKYTPTIASFTFSALLRTDPHKAYEYGKSVLETSAFENPPYLDFIDYIEWYSIALNHFPAEIYELGAEAEQARIGRYADDMDIADAYHKMADFYWYANNKSKAIDAGEKAIKALKNKKGFLKADLAALESRLQQYNDML